MADTDWTHPSAAEERANRELEKNPDLVTELGIGSCNQLQQRYMALQADLEDCWANPDSPPHACATLAMQLRSVRAQLLAAGCRVPVPQ